jgi:hypothetical protein
VLADEDKRRTGDFCFAYAKAFGNPFSQCSFARAKFTFQADYVS